MKRNKIFFKRMATVVLSAILIFGASMPVFASTTSVASEIKSTGTVTDGDGDSVAASDLTSIATSIDSANAKIAAAETTLASIQNSTSDLTSQIATYKGVLAQLSTTGSKNGLQITNADGAKLYYTNELASIKQDLKQVTTTETAWPAYYKLAAESDVAKGAVAWKADSQGNVIAVIGTASTADTTTGAIAVSNSSTVKICANGGVWVSPIDGEEIGYAQNNVVSQPIKISDLAKAANGIAVPTRTGYSFTGWKYIAGSFFVDSTGAVADSGTEITSDLALVAQWNKNDYFVKYAVSLYDINKDGGSLVFGPATGQDYRSSGKSAHSVSGTTNSGNAHRCIHSDYAAGGWALIGKWAAKDPEVYEQCITNGCTASVEMRTTGTDSAGILSGNTYNSMKGDGCSALDQCIADGCQTVSADINGYKSTAVRTTLNKLYSYFPADLQSLIQPKTLSESGGTSDNLWLLNNGEYSSYSRSKVFTTPSAHIAYNEAGSVVAYWTRTAYGNSVHYWHVDGGGSDSYIEANGGQINAISPFFVLK